MQIILDNNIIFSLMKPDSTNSFIFSKLNATFLAPDFMTKEFQKHQRECLKKSGLNEKSFEERKKEIFSHITILKIQDYSSFLKEGTNISPDIDDAPYFAMALKFDCPIWSNDKLLKNQDKVKVLSTEDVINILF